MTKVTGFKGSNLKGINSSKAAGKRRRGAGESQLSDVEEEEVEAEMPSVEAGGKQSHHGILLPVEAGGGPMRREKSKRIALKKKSSRFQAEADEAFAASADLEKLLSRQNPSGWDFMIDPDKRPFYFDWGKGEHLKSKLKKWQLCIREVATESLLRAVDGECFRRDYDGDKDRWAKEGPAHWAALNYLLTELCLTPYLKVPDDPFADFNFQNLPPGDPATEGESDRTARFSNPFERNLPSLHPNLLPRLMRDAVKRRREIEEELDASEDRGASGFRVDTEFPDEYKDLAPFIMRERRS